MSDQPKPRQCEPDADAAALKAFAAKHRLHVRLDECADLYIPGRRGQSQLYFADGEQCLMVIDGPYVLRSRWKTLEARRLWLGDVFQDGRRRVQDVKAEGIPLENAKLAIKLAKVRPKRVMSEAQREVLAKARASSPLQSRKLRAPEHP